MTMRGHCVIESLYKHISGFYRLNCGSSTTCSFPPFFVSVFAFSTDREKFSFTFSWSEPSSFRSHLYHSSLPSLLSINFRLSFLAIDALCSKHNKGQTDNKTFFYLIFPRRVFCYFSQNIMGTEQLPHLITLKQNTYTFYESAAEEFFSHCFQQTFAPSCFLFSLLPICTKRNSQTWLSHFQSYRYPQKAKHFKKLVVKNAKQNLRNLSRKVSENAFDYCFFFLSHHFAKGEQHWWLWLFFSCFSTFLHCGLFRQVPLVHFLLPGKLKRQTSSTSFVVFTVF